MNKEMKLYHSYHIKRKQEHKFLAFIQNRFPKIDYVEENYRIEENKYDSSIEIKPVIECLKTDSYLPKKRKQKCIDLLEDIDKERVVVFKTVNNISFDFTIESDENTFFFELHENQHKTLSVSKKMKIYDTNGKSNFVLRVRLEFTCRQTGPYKTKSVDFSKFFTTLLFIYFSVKYFSRFRALTRFGHYIFLN